MKLKLGTHQLNVTIADLAKDIDSPLGFSVEIKPIKRKRSVEANALYWVIVTALAAEVGLTKAELHEEVLSEKHGYTLVEFRGSIRKHPKGRSHNLTTEDFSELTAIVERWAGEMNIWWDREQTA